MTFARPDMLYLLWAMPLAVLVLIYGAHRRRRILAAFASPQALKKLTAETGVARRRIKAALVVLALAVLIPALAGPQMGHTWQPVERKGIDLMVVLDVSKSMLAQDLPPSRLERAKREVLDLLDRLTGERVGLTVFAGTAFVHCPLTLDQAAFRLFLDAAGPEYAPVGGTNLELALDTAVQALDQPDGGDRAILLITDGEPTTQAGREAALEAAKRAAKAEVAIYCLGIGTPEGAPIPDAQGGFLNDRTGDIVHSRLTEDTLKEIARLGNGAYVRSTTGDEDLQAIYNDRLLHDLSPEVLSEGKKRVPVDRYRWFAGLALALLLAEAFIFERRRLAGLLLVCALLLPGQVMAGVHGDLKQGLEAYNQEQYQEAWDNWLKAQLEEPDNPDVLYDMGAAAYRLERYQEAQQQFEAAAEGYAQASKPLDRAKALYNQGNSLFRQQNLPKAAKSYEQALKLNPDDAEAKSNLEFVKELMKQQPPQQKQQEQQNQQDKQDQQQQDQQQNQNAQSEQDKQDKENQEQQNQQQDQQQQQNQEQQPQSSPDQQEQQPQDQQPQQDDAASMGDQQSEEQQQRDSQAKPGEQDQQDMQAARALLNRLEDKPGKVMPPAYQERSVEKDW